MANQVYKKVGTLGGARHGDSYQVHVLMLIYERAAKDVGHFLDFRLATEMEAAGKFDDAVLTWTCNTEQKWLFVQVKHKQKAKLNELSLFPVEEKDKAKGDFSLYKYLISMSDIMRNNDLEGDKQFILYTNCAIDSAIEKWFIAAQKKDETALLYNNQVPFFKLNVDENRVKTLVDEVNQDFCKLVETIKAIFIEGNADWKADILGKYRGALVQKVLLIDKKIAKFTPRFIKRNNLDYNETLLRQQLFAEDSSLEQLQGFCTPDKQVVNSLSGKSNSENLLPRFISEFEASDYFNRLTFAAAQPDNEELKKMIQNDLEYLSPIQESTARDCYTQLLYNKLQKMVHDWLDSTTNVKYLTHEDLRKESVTLQQTIEQSSSDLPTLKFNGMMQNFRLKFSESMQLPNRFPLAILTTTKSGLFTSLKIFQMLQGKSYRFATLKDLKICRFRKQLCDVICNVTSELFLLIRDDYAKIDDKWELTKILLNNKVVKLIFLTYNEGRAEQLFGKLKYYTFEDCNISLHELNNSSQQMVFKKKVLFQGDELYLTDIFHNESRRKILNDNVLEQMIQNKTIEIGEGLQEMILKSYIPRVLRRCESNESTDADLIDSMEFLNFTENGFIRTISIKSSNSKVVVLSAEPGMGKTTLWTHLAPLIKQSHRSSWVLNIKLLECVNELRKVYRFEDIGTATEALLRICKIKSQFEQSLFAAYLSEKNPKNAFILLDGFDELPFDTITSVISLLKLLQGHAVLFVNTRVHQKVVLDHALNTSTFTLNPINRQEQIMLLSSSCDVPPDDRELTQLVEQLFNKIHSKSLEVADKIIGVPLMVVMLAEIYKPYVQTFIKLKDIRILNTISLKSLTLLNIFELFAYSSFRRQSIEKQKLDVENPNTERLLHKQNYLFKGFVTLHSYLGLVKLVKQQKMHLLFREKLQLAELQEQAALLDSAIVSKYDEGVPHFSHASFCEYFAAKCLFDCLCRMKQNLVKNSFVKKDENRRAPKKQCIDDIYDMYHKVLRDYATVRKFFFLMVMANKDCWNLLDDLFWSMRPYPLLWACEEGFGELVKRLLKEDPSIVNCRSKQMETPLHLAAAQDNYIICALILNEDVDKNADNGKGQTALHVASLEGHYDAASVLLVRGASLRLGDRNLQTPLHLAAQAGHANIVRLLMKNGCDVDALNKREWSALHLAANNGHVEVVKILITKKAQLRIGKLTNLLMFLGQLVRSGYTEIVRMLVKYEVKSNIHNSKIDEVLLWAVRRNHIEIVQAAHEAGAGVHCNDPQTKLCTFRLALQKLHFEMALFIITKRCKSCELHHNPLHAAAEAGSIDCVTFLLKIKAEVNARDENGSTPLELAVKKGHARVVEMLLANGANINQTLLHSAVKNGSSECIKYLIACGADINYAEGINKWTPLHVAVKHDKWACARELLGNEKCQLMAKDSAGQTVFHLANSDDSSLILHQAIFDTNLWRKLLRMRVVRQNEAEARIHELTFSKLHFKEGESISFI